MLSHETSAIGRSKVFLHRRIRNDPTCCQAKSLRSFLGLILPFEASGDHFVASMVSHERNPIAGSVGALSVFESRFRKPRFRALLSQRPP